MQFDLFICVHKQCMLYFDMINVLLQYKVSVKTVYGIRKRHQDTGSVADKPCSGRPKKMTVRQDRVLVHLSLSNRHLTSPQLRQNVETDLRVTVSASTIRKRLDSAGLLGCVAVKKPLLREANIKARLNFARTETGLFSSGICAVVERVI